MLAQSFRMAFSSIASNKMRSFLTMLGIIIGIMAVVVLVSIVSGATSSVMGSLESLGAEKLSVNIMDSRNRTFSLAELNEMAAGSESIALVAPQVTGSSTVKAGDTSASGSIVGTTPQYMEIEQLDLQYGRSIKTPDLENSSAVAVIGQDIAEDLFSSADVVGQTFSIDGRTFTVVGVLEDAGSSIMGSTNSKIIIPYTLAQRMYGVKGVTSFTALAADSESVDSAEAYVEATLLEKYKDEDSYNIFNQSTMLESMSSITDTMSLMMGGIGGISLLVGGIGIMNIMLVSVAERTREIGIRKAIGAGRRRILMQFLIEALVLSLLGGLVGIGLSALLLTILSAALSASYTMSMGVALLAVGFSLAIGLIFGINPANKAAKMPPIVALRTE